MLHSDGSLLFSMKKIQSKIKRVQILTVHFKNDETTNVKEADFKTYNV